MRLKVIWEDQAVADLAELTGRDRRRAKFLYDTIRRMGKLGWAYMGRPVDDDLMYFTVNPFGVFYDINRYPHAIAIVRMVDARRLPQRPERRFVDELRRPRPGAAQPTELQPGTTSPTRRSPSAACPTATCQNGSRVRTGPGATLWRPLS